MIDNLYWILISDKIETSLLVSSIFLPIITLILFFVWNDDDFREGKDVELYSTMWILPLVLSIASIIGYTLTPNTKQALIIAGAETVSEYINSNEKLKSIPDKVVDVVDNSLNKAVGIVDNSLDVVNSATDAAQTTINTYNKALETANFFMDKYMEK